jgi:hypothetical protein
VNLLGDNIDNTKKKKNRNFTWLLVRRLV